MNIEDCHIIIIALIVIIIYLVYIRFYKKNEYYEDDEQRLDKYTNQAKNYVTDFKRRFFGVID